MPNCQIFLTVDAATVIFNLYVINTDIFMHLWTRPFSCRAGPGLFLFMLAINLSQNIISLKIRNSQGLSFIYPSRTIPQPQPSPQFSYTTITYFRCWFLLYFLLLSRKFLYILKVFLLALLNILP